MSNIKINYLGSDIAKAKNDPEAKTAIGAAKSTLNSALNTIHVNKENVVEVWGSLVSDERFIDTYDVIYDIFVDEDNDGKSDCKYRLRLNDLIVLGDKADYIKISL